jgi:hypothetical protein
MRPALARLVMIIALAPLAALGQESANPSFNLVNRGNQVITEIYATPSRTDRWGGDRLSRFNLPPGQTFPVRLPAAGDCLYDIRVVYAGRPPEEARRVDVCRLESMSFPGGRNTGAPGRGEARSGTGGAATDDPSFRLINRGRSEINEVYVSPSGDDEWGSDRLGDDTVAQGRTRVVRLPSGQCTWDLRVVFANGEATEKRRLDLCAITDLRVP